MHRLRFVAFAGLAILAGIFVIWSDLFREEPLRRAGLIEEAMTLPSPTEAGPQLNALFARFLPEQARLDERLPILAANGFRCGIEPALAKGGRQLSCRRPVEGTGYCDGFIYFGYETANGEVIESMVAPFKKETPFFGRCEDNRRLFRGLQE